MKRYYSSVASSSNLNTPIVESNSNPSNAQNLLSSEIEVEYVEVESVEVGSEEVKSDEIDSIEVVHDELPADPGLRKDMSDYPVNDMERIRRAYLQKGPCQPRGHDFPKTSATLASKPRRFVPAWFKKYSNWLEYSISKDAAYCLPCYLFKPDYGNQGGGDTFVGEGFRNWKKPGRLQTHVGGLNSLHNQCVQDCDNLMKQKRHIEACLHKHSAQSKIDYRARLIASIDCIRLCLLQGLALRGHDESETSANQGNFLEILHFLADHNDEVKRVVLDNAPMNLKLTSPDIQKDIINAFATETTHAIINDMGDNLFSVLVDEARDISVKEQMAVVLRFVDDRGFVLERLLGIIHVPDTSALSLKGSIEALFCKYGLSISSLRGQGYDGASNMSGEFNGLKSLIMKENPYAYYTHCFAHQLQLALVSVAQHHSKVEKFFYNISFLTNIVSASCKRKDLLRTKALKQVNEALSEGEIMSGRGQNQEVSLGRAGNTRWNSHYRTLVNLIVLFDPVVEVLMTIQKESIILCQRAQADNLLDYIMCFEFAFCLFLMKTILGISNALSQELQRKDQDMVSAMHLVRVSKQLLQQMRDEGWGSLCDKVVSFCTKHNINVPNMEEVYIIPGRARRNIEKATNFAYYRELFNEVIDKQLSELNSRFNEVNTELLLCMSCLDPREAFSAFDHGKLMRLAELYPTDFSTTDLVALEQQLDGYVVDVRFDDRFADLPNICELSKKLVQTKKHRVYPLVYLLLKLALLLPVATATVERVFSAMKLIKSSLRNRLGDELMNDCLVTYIEKDVAKSIEIEDIINRFQEMAPRRMLL